MSTEGGVPHSGPDVRLAGRRVARTAQAILRLDRGPHRGELVVPRDAREPPEERLEMPDDEPVLAVVVNDVPFAEEVGLRSLGLPRVVLGQEVVPFVVAKRARLGVEKVVRAAYLAIRTPARAPPRAAATRRMCATSASRRRLTHRELQRGEGHDDATGKPDYPEPRAHRGDYSARAPRRLRDGAINIPNIAGIVAKGAGLRDSWSPPADRARRSRPCRADGGRAR